MLRRLYKIIEIAYSTGTLPLKLETPGKSGRLSGHPTLTSLLHFAKNKLMFQVISICSTGDTTLHVLSQQF